MNKTLNTPPKAGTQPAGHTAAHRIVTEVMHNRMPSLELVQEARDVQEELVDALIAIYSDSQLPKVVKEFYSKQIDKALLNAQGQEGQG